MFTAEDFIPNATPNTIADSTFKWSAPSNIAIVKYWGKMEHQIPANPSLSFTLKNCKTVTSLAFKNIKRTSDFSFDLLFEGQPKDDFRPKILQFLTRIEPFMPFLKDFHWHINTYNTFPHSSGIASSASAMAALAMNFVALERELYPTQSEDYYTHKASFLARLGSGSACRSIKGEVVIWGEHQDTPNSSNLYGVAFEQLHPNFHRTQDTILLVDKGEKAVSSTAGHELMNGHPFAQNRFEQAHQNLSELKAILTAGDWNAFIALMEHEALTLHAMMMTSKPYYILMKPNTLEIIQKIWRFRNTTKATLGFTLDAGANVHLLYPENERDSILQFIKNELVGYCQNSQYICDEIGDGARIEK